MSPANANDFWPVISSTVASAVDFPKICSYFIVYVCYDTTGAYCKLENYNQNNNRMRENNEKPLELWAEIVHHDYANNQPCINK